MITHLRHLKSNSFSCIFVLLEIKFSQLNWFAAFCNGIHKKNESYENPHFKHFKSIGISFMGLENKQTLCTWILKFIQ